MTNYELRITDEFGSGSESESGKGNENGNRNRKLQTANQPETINANNHPIPVPSYGTATGMKSDHNKFICEGNWDQPLLRQSVVCAGCCVLQ